MLTLLAWLATPQTLNFHAQIDPWQASCAPLVAGAAADCGTPTATDTSPGTVDLALTLAGTAGQATQIAQPFSLPGSTPFSGVVTLYSVYPTPDSGFPPYIQVRIDLAGPARATCAESVRLRDPMELPPVICAAFEPPVADGSATQAGVTITFN